MLEQIHLLKRKKYDNINLDIIYKIPSAEKLINEYKTITTNQDNIYANKKISLTTRLEQLKNSDNLLEEIIKKLLKELKNIFDKKLKKCQIEFEKIVSDIILKHNNKNNTNSYPSHKKDKYCNSFINYCINKRNELFNIIEINLVENNLLHDINSTTKLINESFDQVMNVNFYKNNNAKLNSTQRQILFIRTHIEQQILLQNTKCITPYELMLERATWFNTEGQPISVPSSLDPCITIPIKKAIKNDSYNICSDLNALIGNKLLTELYDIYIITSFEQLILIQLLKIIEFNYKIQFCKVCNNVFASIQSKSIYCPSCKKIAQKKQAALRALNPLYRDQERIRHIIKKRASNYKNSKLRKLTDNEAQKFLYKISSYENEASEIITKISQEIIGDNHKFYEDSKLIDKLKEKIDKSAEIKKIIDKHHNFITKYDIKPSRNYSKPQQNTVSAQ